VCKTIDVHVHLLSTIYEYSLTISDIIQFLSIRFFLNPNLLLPTMYRTWPTCLSVYSQRQFCVFYFDVSNASDFVPHTLLTSPNTTVHTHRLRLKCDGTRAETAFHLSAKRTSRFHSAGASVQSTTGSRVVRMSGNNAGCTMFRGSVKAD